VERQGQSIRALIAVAVIALAGLASAAAADAGKRGGKAGQRGPTVKKSVWGPVSHNGQSLFPTYRDLGIGLYSIQARWEMVAPTARPLNPTDPADPAYQWPAYLTDAIEGALANGMQVQVLLMGAPPWANGGRSWKWAPDRTSDFADFATAAARRYPGVRHWMIWGEPNRKPNFGPFTPSKSARGPLNKAQQRAPRRYAQLLDAAYWALKAQNRRNLVIGGNTFTSAGPADINTYAWMRYMKLPGGKRPHMDMWGHNPWGNKLPRLTTKPSPRGSVAFRDLRHLTRALDKTFKRKRLKLFLAEWGVPTGFRDKDLNYGLKPKEAKRWTRAAYRIVRKWKRIYTLGWVHMVDTERNSTGLLGPNGSRKPTYKAFKFG
jgi:hypothetical protein